MSALAGGMRTWGATPGIRPATRYPAPAGRRASRRASVVSRIRRAVALTAAIVRAYVTARFVIPSLSERVRDQVLQRSAGATLGALEIAVRARGHLPAPDRPLLLVANHQSWLDSYALNTVSPARFVAKSEVRGWPLIGAIAAGFGTFFLKRGCCRAAARMVAVLAEVLAGGRPVAVFPEGTTGAGPGVLSFYPAMFQAAVRSGVPVQPVAVRYCGAGGAPSAAAAYVGDTPLWESIARIVREPALTVELIFCAPLLPDGRTRRELAAAAHAAITAALAGTDTTNARTRRAA